MIYVIMHKMLMAAHMYELKFSDRLELQLQSGAAY